MVTQQTQTRPTIFVGIDTHKDSHTAAAVTAIGTRLGTLKTGVGGDSSRLIADWAQNCGVVNRYGIEGTGSYGKTLALSLIENGARVDEVKSVNRQHQRRYGKSDSQDAYSAALTTASGETQPCKQTTGDVEIIRVLQTCRTTAVRNRTQLINKIKAIIVTSPRQIRDCVRDMSNTKLLETIVAWRPGTGYLDNQISAVKHCLKILAKKWGTLNTEIAQADSDLTVVMKRHAPQLLDTYGVGTDVAAKLVIAAGSNPQRMNSEAGFAALCGVSPVDASSGKQQRHRLNRSGNRQANNALYTIALTRMRHDPRTQQYITKKEGEGKTKKEIIRLLKRYIARQIYKKLATKLP